MTMQAMGAVTPAMTALATFLLLGTMEQPLTYATLIPVMVGIVLAAGFEPALNIIGFLACFGASGARALKAVLQVRGAHLLHVILSCTSCIMHFILLFLIPQEILW